MGGEIGRGVPFPLWGPDPKDVLRDYLTDQAQFKNLAAGGSSHGPKLKIFSSVVRALT